MGNDRTSKKSRIKKRTKKEVKTWGGDQGDQNPTSERGRKEEGTKRRKAGVPKPAKKQNEGKKKNQGHRAWPRIYFNISLRIREKQTPQGVSDRFIRKSFGGTSAKEEAEKMCEGGVVKRILLVVPLKESAPKRFTSYPS